MVEPAETPATLDKTSLVPTDKNSGGPVLTTGFINFINDLVGGMVKAEDFDLVPTLINEATGEEINDPNVIAFLQNKYCDET